MVRWQSEVWAYRTRTVRAVYAAHPPGRRVLVRYEDLVADPAGELARVCAVLPLADCGDRLAGVAAEHAFAAVPPGRKGEGKEIRSASPGGWRDNLTPAEHEVMAAIMGDELAALGYPPA
jgi:hypothetical protein